MLYPASEISPYEQVLSSPDNIASQMEVLLRLQTNADNNHLIVIVPARALMQRVLDKQTLVANTITLAKGQEIDRDRLAQQLTDLGYKREALASLRGEFSIRGDIIDVYPSTSNPVRLELFGDQIESIRSFGIDNQRSVASCDSAIIPPRYWVTLHNDDARADFIKNMEASTARRAEEIEPAAAETLRSIIEEEKLSFAANLYPESIEYYAPFFHDQFASLIDYVPDNAIFAFDDWDATMLSLNSYDERLRKSYSEGLESGRLLPLPGPLHLSFNDCSNRLKTENRLFFSTLPAFTTEAGIANISSPDIITHSINFNCHPVEHFANQMKTVVEKIRILQADGFTVLINSEQPQRIIDLLREWDCVSVYIGTNEGGTHEQTMPSAALNTVLVSRHGFLRGFILDEIALAIITDTELFGLKRKPLHYRRQSNEKSHESFTSVSDLKIGDYVVHIKHGIGQFTGVQRISIDNEQREYVTVQYAVDDKLYVPVDQINLLSRYRGAGEAAPRLSRLGGTEWENTKRRVKRSVKQVAEDLVNLYAMRAKQQGFASLPDTPWQYEMEEAFPFEETPDQWQAIVDTKKDLESIKPMDRLICGDVGFGKTEVAIRAVFKTVMSGKQVAVLVPTTILAQQHFNTLSERFAPFPLELAC